jgi:8-oxo-dGTP diphosphatase
MKLATLLYIKNAKGEYLLIRRAKEPNKGMLSPPGGKLETTRAESPIACAVREGFEECGIVSKTADWNLIGIVTEKDYPKAGNIMMFLFEYLYPLNELPASFDEGDFIFINKDELNRFLLPETDKLFIWDFVLKGGKNIFFLSIDYSDNKYKCTIG